MKDKIVLSSDANMLRMQFGEDLMTPVDIFALMGRLENLTMVFRPFSAGISGMCLKSNQDNIIAINSTLSYGRQRYTAAHELYHLFIQENLQSVVCEMAIETEKPEEEKEADLFASYFLAPYDALKFFIQDSLHKKPYSINVDDVVQIEQYFQISRQAVLFRLINEGYLTRDDAEQMKLDVIRSARRAGFDTALYLPTNPDKQYRTQGNYIKLAEKLKDQNLISDGKYEELLLEAFRADIVYATDSEGVVYD